MKRILSVISAMLLTVSFLVMPGISAATFPFADVQEDDWFYEAVEQIYADGLIEGRTPNGYYPHDTITRAEFVVLMSRICGEDVSGFGYGADGFSDVNQSSWYREYIGWAAGRGLVNGYDGGIIFRPEAPILRQELSVLIVRLMEYMNTVLPLASKIERFSDDSDIPGWAADGIEELRITGLLAGDERGRINPGVPLTRAEAAVLLYRFTAALKLDPMFGFFDRAEEIAGGDDGRIPLMTGSPETVTADNLTELIFERLGLNSETYILEFDSEELVSLRNGEYSKSLPGDRFEVELTVSVRNRFTGQATNKKQLLILLIRQDEMYEDSYPEFFYKIKLDGTAEITDYHGTENVRSLVIPSMIGEVRVTSIGELAFAESRELESVTIPQTVTRIGTRAFELCTSLTGVDIPDSVTEVGRAAFYYCTALKSVRLPGQLKHIPDYMFYMCTSLANVLPPEELTEIGAYAFSCCKIENFVFSDGLWRIGDYSFEGCEISSVSIPDSCYYIGNWAFYNCTALTDAHLGRGLTYLGSGVFYGTSLTDVYYSGTVAEYAAVVKKSPLLGDQKIVCEGGRS